MKNCSLLLIFAAVLLLGGCATEGTSHSSHNESSLPWNRPQSWEGAGAMGAAMQGTP